MEMRADGIIFDVDGTLWDSTEIVAGAWNQAIIEEGITDVHLTGEILKGLFGKTMDVIARNILPLSYRRTEGAHLERCCRYGARGAGCSEEDITLPQVIEVMQTCGEVSSVYCQQLSERLH